MRVTKLLGLGAGIAGASYATYVASTFLRYGHVKPPHGKAADPLLDSFMPTPDVREKHTTYVEAPADVTYAAGREFEIESSRIVRAIFKARELILRSAPVEKPRVRGFIEWMKAIGWGVLAEKPGRELVMGAVTKPWEANPVFRPVPPEEFAAFAEPDYVKIVWTVQAIPLRNGASLYRTETRAVATDAQARRKFRLYWSLLSPGIILIRRALLPAVKATAERMWQLEGDDIIAEPRAQFTHAVTIDAPPSDVWPWLVQMGGQRAGWYSWDILDNGGVRSAEHIIPRLQHLDLGEVIPGKPAGTEGFRVLRMVPERALVLGGGAEDFDGTWAFVLEPVGENRTRLVTRYRAQFEPSRRMLIKVPMMAAVHGFMERKQLRTIKHHAEHMH